MITAFEIAAIFKLTDEATLPLRRIAEEAKALADQLKGIIDLGPKLDSSFATTFKTMTGNVAAATREVSLLAGEWAKVEKSAAAAAAAAKGAGVPGGGVPRGPTFRPGTSPRGPHIPTIPGANVVPGGGALNQGDWMTALVAAAGYGAYQSAELESAAQRAVFVAHQGQTTPDADVLQKQRDQFKEIVQQVQRQTGVPQKDVAEALTNEIRQGKGFAWDKRIIGAVPLLETAAMEAQLKPGTSFKEASDSLIKYAHMIKEYDPVEMIKHYPELQYLASTSPQTINRMAVAAGYHIPTSMVMDVNPIEEMILQTGLERAGVTSTKSGTWLREMAQRALPPQEDLMKPAHFQMMSAGLKELGLLDQAGKATWFTGGKPDELKMLEIVAQHAKGIDPERLVQLERSVFGARGGGALGVLADDKVIPQLKVMETEIKGMRDGAKEYFSETMKNNPVLQFNRALQEASILLTQLGTVVLPSVLGAFQGIDTLLHPLHTIMPNVSPGFESQLAKDTARAAVTSGGNPAIIAYQELKVIGSYLMGLNKPLSDIAKDAPAATQSLGWFDRALKALGGGGGDIPPMRQKSSFNLSTPIAPGQKQAINVPVKLTLDSRVLADSMSSALAEAALYPTAAPYHNADQSVASNDMQTTST